MSAPPLQSASCWIKLSDYIFAFSFLDSLPLSPLSVGILKCLGSPSPSFYCPPGQPFYLFLSPSPHMIFDIQTSGRMYSIIVYFFTGRQGNGSPGCKDKRSWVWSRGEIDDKIYSQYGMVPACLFVSLSVRLTCPVLTLEGNLFDGHCCMCPFCTRSMCWFTHSSLAPLHHPMTVPHMVSWKVVVWNYVMHLVQQSNLHQCGQLQWLHDNLLQALDPTFLV